MMENAKLLERFVTQSQNKWEEEELLSHGTWYIIYLFIKVFE